MKQKAPPKRKSPAKKETALVPVSLVQEPVERTAIDTWMDAVDKQTLEDALAFSDDARFQRFLSIWQSPDGLKRSAASIAQTCGIRLDEFVKFYQNSAVQRGMVRMSEHLPQVLEDVAVDAKSKYVMCETCGGEGEISDKKGKNERVCPTCKGKGEVRKVGDSDSRKLVFESIGLTGKRGPMVAIQQNFEGLQPLEDVTVAVNKALNE